MFTATVPAWVFALVVLALTLLFAAACILLAKAEQEVKQWRRDAWDLKAVKAQRDKLNHENANLAKECNIAVQAFAELDMLYQKATKERDEWQGLYNELRDTYAAAQGDVHATVPLQEAVPFVIGPPVKEVAPEPVKPIPGVSPEFLDKLDQFAAIEVPFTTNPDGTFNVEAQPVIEQAAAPVKRTRKKAEKQ